MTSAGGIVVLAIAGLLVGCGGDPLASGAAGCWGAGAGDCAEALAVPLRALGHRATDSFEQAMVGGSCGGFMDCAGVAAKAIPTSPPKPIQREPVDRPTPRVNRPTPRVDRPTPRAQRPTPRPVEPTPDPVVDSKPTPEQLASLSGACRGLSIASLEKRSRHSSVELRCLLDTAHGRTGAGDADVQIAAITVANAKSKGWAKAVEAALKRGALGNAPQLNFAGIGPAYSGKRYSTALKRARIVWKNRGKGYQLSARDLTYVVEYACRSAGQLALSGKPSGDGLDWCERWLDRAERAGQPTGAIEDLIRQVE